MRNKGTERVTIHYSDIIQEANLPILQQAVAMKQARAGLTKKERVKAFSRLGPNNLEYRQEYAHGRIEVITNNVWSDLQMLAYFKVEDIEDDDPPPILRTMSPQRIRVGYINANGEPKRNQWIDKDTTQHVTYKRLISEPIEYPLVDPNAGTLDLADEAFETAERNHQAEIERLAKALLDVTGGYVATFATGQIYQHQDIAADAVPAGNLIATTAGNGIEKDHFKTIADYANRMGLKIKTIDIPAVDAKDLWDWATIVSGVTGIFPDAPKEVVPVSVTENLWRTGTFSEAYGHNFIIRPINTQATGTIRVSFDKPAGTIWRRKIGGNVTNVFIDDSFKAKLANTESVAMDTYIGFTSLGKESPNTFKLTYT